MKYTTTFVLALTWMCFCSALNLHAQFSEGTGTASDPFKIKTADDLNNVRNYADKHFRLMNDIDLTSFLQSSTEGWLPIENFSGYFHGGGYKINGLWINRPTVDYVGFFGANSGTIDSLMLIISDDITGRIYVGGFVGDNSGTIIQCGVEGGSSITISGNRAGGFAGNNSNILSHCYSTISSSANLYYISTSQVEVSSYSGGLIGYNAGTISDCYATGNSSSSAVYNSYSGGFVGYSTETISNCYATGNSTAFPGTQYNSGGDSGGFVGYSTGTISNCYATGTATTTAPATSYSSYSGGFVGVYNAGTINNCYAAGQVISNIYKGAFAGYCSYSNNFSQCYYNFDINGLAAIGYDGYSKNVSSNNIVGVNTAEMKSKSTFVNWDFYNIWTIENEEDYPYLYSNMPPNKIFIDGEVSSCGNFTQTYTINEENINSWDVINGTIISGQLSNTINIKWDNVSWDGIIRVSNNSSVGTKYVKLTKLPQPTIRGNMNSIAGNTESYSTEYGMSNYNWTVTGGDIIDGLGTQEITVLWKNAKDGHITLNYTNEGGCSASIVTDSLVHIKQLFANGDGSINSPYIIKTAEQLDNIRIMPDAVYSLANDIDLTDYLKNTATGWNTIPNFSGTFDGRFFKIKGLWINQVNNDNIGLFAANNGTIENVYVEIDSKGIYGNNYVSGLAANNYGTILQCSVKEGSLTSKGTDVGSLVGRNQGIINLCYSINTVVWGTEGVGGLLGSTWGVDAKIQQCYAINTVVGSQYVGGLIGDMYDATCNQSYSASIVEAGNYTGGFLGFNGNGIIAGCYYDAYNSGQASGLGNDDSQANNIRAKQPSEMLSRSTFLGWDFNNVWTNTDGETYPYFRWQDIVPTPPSAIGRIQSNQQPLTVYPNPTNGMVYIQCIPQSLVSIYNSIGKLVHQFITKQDETGVDMSAYPVGIYIFRTENQIIKVIKK